MSMEITNIIFASIHSDLALSTSTKVNAKYIPSDFMLLYRQTCIWCLNPIQRLQSKLVYHLQCKIILLWNCWALSPICFNCIATPGIVAEIELESYQVERLQRKFTTIHSTLAQQAPKPPAETPRNSVANLSQSVLENLPKVQFLNLSFQL